MASRAAVTTSTRGPCEFPPAATASPHSHVDDVVDRTLQLSSWFQQELIMTTYTEHVPDPGIAPPAMGFADRRVTPVAASGFGLASLFGLGIGIISIVALDGYSPRVWASIATIAVGAILLLEGSGLGSRLARGARVRNIVGGGTLGVEVVAGIAAAVLGILALLDISSWLLLEIACIAFGAAFVLGSGGAFHHGSLGGPARRSDDVSHRVLVATYASARPIAGIGAVILGILSLLSIGEGHAMIFVLVSLLAIGAASLLGGLAVGGGVARRSLV
jgi:hypothetical protein